MSQPRTGERDGRGPGAVADRARRKGNQVGLSGSLKRLVTDPRRLSTVSLWQALSADEREQAARSYLDTDETGRGHLDKVVAEARNFRPATVLKWPDGKITAWCTRRRKGTNLSAFAAGIPTGRVRSRICGSLF